MWWRAICCLLSCLLVQSNNGGSITDRLLSKNIFDACHPIIQTVVYAITLMQQNVHAVPQLDSSGAIKIMFLGCRESFEGSLDLESMFDVMQQTILPELKRLDVLMMGPEMDNARDGKYYYSETITISRWSTLLSRKSEISVAANNSFCIILNPGFTDNLETWKDGIEKLLEMNILSIATGYSEHMRWTHDSLFDEEILSRYFGANVLIPITRNPFAMPNTVTSIYKMAYIIVFQGHNDHGNATLTTSALMKRLAVRFLRHVAVESSRYEDAPQSLVDLYNTIAEEIDSGKIVLPPSWTLHDLERHVQELHKMRAEDL